MRSAHGKRKARTNSARSAWNKTPERLLRPRRADDWVGKVARRNVCNRLATGLDTSARRPAPRERTGDVGKEFQL